MAQVKRVPPLKQIGHWNIPCHILPGSTSLGPAARLLACSRLVCPVTEMCFNGALRKARENARNQLWSGQQPSALNGNIAMILWGVLSLRAFWESTGSIKELVHISFYPTSYLIPRTPSRQFHSSQPPRTTTDLPCVCLCVCVLLMWSCVHVCVCACVCVCVKACQSAYMGVLNLLPQVLSCARKLIRNHAHSRPFRWACQQGWASSCH